MGGEQLRERDTRIGDVGTRLESVDRQKAAGVTRSVRSQHVASTPATNEAASRPFANFKEGLKLSGPEDTAPVQHRFSKAKAHSVPQRHVSIVSIL